MSIVNSARPLILFALCMAWPLAPALSSPARQAQDGQALLAEGDALADQGKYDAAVLTYMKAYEMLLPGMRGHEFKRSVEGRLMPRKELEEYLHKLADEELKPEDVRGDQLLLKALGLVPADFELRDTMLSMLTEEIGGFYDPEAEAMFLIHEPLPEGPPKEPGFFAKLFGARPAFDKDETKGVLAHEMAHALADQTFDLEAMTQRAEGDSDRELALTALVEGEAMLAMIGATGEDWDGTATAQLPARVLERSLAMAGPLMAMAGGETFRSAPPVMTETLLFPYLRGMVFCASVTNQGGWPALDDVFKNPPISTEQILHPAKYLGRGYDAPQRIDTGELDPGGDWEQVQSDVVGELVISIMLRQHRGRPAAAGWDGDSCTIFEGAQGALAVVWITTWDTPGEAREFAQHYADYQGERFGLRAETAPAQDAQDAADAPAPKAAPAVHFKNQADQSLRRVADGKVLHIELRGSDVAIVEGFDEPMTSALVKTALAATKQEVEAAN